MLKHLSKKVKKEVLRLNGLVYERRLAAALRRLRREFDGWQGGRLQTFDLAEVIHQFHDGPNRDLYKDHVMAEWMADFWVAGALECGILKEEEVSEETRDALRNIHGAVFLPEPETAASADEEPEGKQGQGGGHRSSET